MEDFKIGDKVVFAKLMWRGYVCLLKGTVSRITPKNIVVNQVEGEDIKRLYVYKRNGEIQVQKDKAMVIK